MAVSLVISPVTWKNWASRKMPLRQRWRSRVKFCGFYRCASVYIFVLVITNAIDIVYMVYIYTYRYKTCKFRTHKPLMIRYFSHSC